jgi:hypothetical protein
MEKNKRMKNGEVVKRGGERQERAASRCDASFKYEWNHSKVG